MDVRLVPAAAGVWLTSLAVTAGYARVTVLAVVAALVVVMVVRVGRGAWREGVVPGVAFACAASLTAGLTADAALAVRIPWEHLTSVQIAGVVVEAAPRGETTSVLVEVDRWRDNAGDAGEDAPWMAGSGRVRAIVEGPAPRWGESVVATGQRWEEATRPVLIDAVASRSPPTGVTALAAAARAGLERVAAPLPPAREALVLGMAIGDDSAMPDDLDLALQVSGLAHLTAVSGAHFAIVMGAVLAIVGMLAAPRWVSGLVVVATSAALAAVVTGGGSVTRALAMACVAALAIALGRRHQPIPTVATGVIVLITVDPGLASDLGFALSVAAVTGIATLAAPLSRQLSGLAPWLAQAIGVTVAAQVATLPLLVGWAAELGPWAVAANAVAAPFAVPATLAGVGALVCATWWPAGAAVLAHVAALATVPIEAAARAFSEAPGAGVRWRDGVDGIVLAIFVVVAVSAAMAMRRRRVWALGAAVLVVLVATAPSSWLPPVLGGPARGWHVLACDVAQGDALVVRGGGATVMIDTGEANGLAQACLDTFGITRLDLVVLTHAHADHVGGLEEVAEAASIAQVWIPPGAQDHTRDQARATGAVLIEPDAGDRVSLGALAVEVLQVGPEPASRDGAAVNDASIVVGVSVEGSRVMALGDLELDGQARLLETLAAPSRSHWLAAEVLKVAHHGSPVQDPRLLAAVRPRLALVSAGADNEYGHPHADVLAALESQGAQVWRTDQCGHLAVALDDGAATLVSRCQSDVAG